MHILQSTFFLPSSQSNPVLPCFLCKVSPTRIFVKEEEEEWVELVLVPAGVRNEFMQQEGRCSKNSSQPSEEIAVGRELLSRNVLTFSNFSCFPFPPLHRRDIFIIIILTLEMRQIKQRDPELLAGHPSLFHPFFSNASRSFFCRRIRFFLS